MLSCIHTVTYDPHHYPTAMLFSNTNYVKSRTEKEKLVAYLPMKHSMVERQKDSQRTAVF